MHYFYQKKIFFFINVITAVIYLFTVEIMLIGVVFFKARMLYKVISFERRVFGPFGGSETGVAFLSAEQSKAYI